MPQDATTRADGFDTPGIFGSPAGVLSLDAPPLAFTLDLGVFAGPPSQGVAAARPRPMGTFNPSIAPAPPSLCRRCAFVATLRVDALHQCNASSPLYYTVGNREPGLRGQVGVGAWFKGTALVVLDASYTTLGWTWLLVSPEKQISRADPNATSRWHVPLGAAGRFGPPWAAPVYDARIFNFEGTLFSSQVCKACDFSVTQLRLAADPTADGGVANLQAWATRRFVVREGWAAGRNQALFAARPAAGSPTALMLQPWLGLVGSLGRPRYKVETVNCTEKNFRVRHNGHGGKGSRLVCGTHIGPALPVAAIENDMHARRRGPGWFGQLELVSNVTASAAVRSLKAAGLRVSATANLVRIRRGVGERRCEALLGVGHVHRREGRGNMVIRRREALGCASDAQCNRMRAEKAKAKGKGKGRGRRNNKGRRRLAEVALPPKGRRLAPAPLPVGWNLTRPLAAGGWRRERKRTSMNSRTGFRWGYEYTHFWYAVEPVAPFRLLAASDEWCIGAAGAPGDCESIQFVSGLAVAGEDKARRARLRSGGGGDGVDGGRVVLAYGVNDCEAKLGEISLTRVWQSLRPLEGGAGDGGGGVCTRVGEGST